MKIAWIFLQIMWDGINKFNMMKKFKIDFLIIPALIVFLASCELAGSIDDENFATIGNAPIAAWIESAEGSDDLILSDITSSVEYEVEFIDTSNGSTVESFEMIVSDGENSGSLINMSTFSETSSGLMGFSGSFSLSDIFGVLGTSASDYAEEDTLSFSSTVTSGGVVYPSGNSNTFSTSINDFELYIPVETISLASFSFDSVYLNSNSAETITMAFENDFTSELVVIPTIERLSAQGRTDDVVGDVVAVAEEDSDDFTYTFNYNPGEVDYDTISFVVSGGSAFADGFVMASKSYSAVFFIDNVDPTESFDNSGLVLSGGDTVGYKMQIAFSEDIGSISISENVVGVDDDEDGELDEEDEFTSIDATFSENILSYTYPWNGFSDGEVELTLMMKDLAGNILDYGTYVTLTPAD